MADAESAAGRLLDAEAEEDLENTVPLLGVFDAELLCLSDAVARTGALDEASQKAVLYSAKQGAKRALKRAKEKGTPAASLSEDEAGAVHLYTLESPLYKQMNQHLRRRDRSAFKPFFPFLRLLLTALQKLPRADVVVYRGVKIDLASKYPEGEAVTWWSFSSSTSEVGVLKNDQFLGDQGKRTIFSVRTTRAVDVSALSALPFEKEMLVLPGSVFEVKSTLPLGNGLTMVQLEQDADAPELIPGFGASAVVDGIACAVSVREEEHCTDRGRAPRGTAHRSLRDLLHHTQREAQQRRSNELVEYHHRDDDRVEERAPGVLELRARGGREGQKRKEGEGRSTRGVALREIRAGATRGVGDAHAAAYLHFLREAKRDARLCHVGHPSVPAR